MLKLIDLDSSYFGEEPLVTVLDVKAGGFTKAASDSRVSAFMAGVKPDPSKIYVHILAMGAGEYFGANRNADYFPEENLIKCFKTFETTPAHIFKHHINKDPTIAMGQVIFAIYNERMHRVEVVAWIDRIKGADYVRRIEMGEFPATSMACHTPFDTCSICGNQARSRGEYCVHLTNELGRTYPDGRKVMAINDGFLNFFDMSLVFRPADITSGVLQKLASLSSDLTYKVKGSAQSAEESDLCEKSAEIKKLSELIKEVEGEITGYSNSVESLLNKIKDPDEEILNFLIHYDIDDVLHALAELGISPSVKFFAKLIGQKMCGESVDGIEFLIDGLIKEDAKALSVPRMVEKSASVYSKSAILSALTPFVKQSSLFPEMAMARAVQYNPLVHVGFSQQGPEVQPDPRESYLKMKKAMQDGSPGMLKTLFSIAGAAIAAKWLLSRMIEDRMQEVMAKSHANSQPAIKIVLVKSAQEALTAQRLVKADLFRNLT